MEFFSDVEENLKPCVVCRKLTDIFYSKTLEEGEDIFYICPFHYVELIEKYLDGSLEPNYNLFPAGNDMLSLPVNAAKIEYGSSIPIQFLLKTFLDKINTKLKMIKDELELISKNSNCYDQNFISLIEKDQLDKKLMKLLILCNLQILKL